MALRVVVCVKPVPDPRQTAGGPVVAGGRTTVNREAVTLVPNRNDRVALEMALRLRDQSGGGSITVVLMGPPAAEPVARECLALGADEAWLVSDRALAGSDALATARVLAAAVRRREEFDLVLTGAESSDGGTGQVGPALATFLGLPHLCGAIALRAVPGGPESGSAESGGARSPIETTVARQTARGPAHQVFECRLPLLVTVSRAACQPRATTMLGIVKARSRPLVGLNCAQLVIDPATAGERGSPTRVSRLVPYTAGAKAEMLEGAPEEQVVALVRLLKDKGLLAGGADPA